MGTAVTAGASNSDGSAVTLLSALTHDVEYLVIGAGRFSAVNEDTSTLLDILIDPAGGTSWSSLIDDLLVGESVLMGGATAIPCPVWYHFPLWIPAGAAVGAMARTARGSTLAGQVLAFGYGANANPSSWWCGQRVSSIGINAAASMGQDHTGGNGAFSTWADLGSPLGDACGALQFAVHGANNDTNTSNAAYHFEFGVGGNRIGPTIFRMNSTGEAGWWTPTGPIFHSLPAGAQLQVRAFQHLDVLDVAAYAVH